MNSEPAVLQQMSAVNGRVRQLMRLEPCLGRSRYQLILQPLGWPERFSEGARCAGFTALVLTGPFAFLALLYALLIGYVNSFDPSLLSIALVALAALGAAAGFLIGAFARQRPYQFVATFDDTTIVNGRDKGALRRVDAHDAGVVLVTVDAQTAIALRSPVDAEALAGALRRLVLQWSIYRTQLQFPRIRWSERWQFW